MKTRIASLFILIGLLLGACSTPGNSETEATAIPTVISDKTLIAEGRLEPLHYAEIAFNASGVIAEVLVDEGTAVKKGQPLLRLGNGQSARAEVAKAQEALIVAERNFNAAQADALKTLGDAYEAVRLAQINLDNYDVPSYLADGTPAEGVERMYARLEEARKAYLPYEFISKNNKVRRQQKKYLDDAWDRFNRAIRWATLEAELQQAQSELDNAQKEFTAETNESQQGGSLARAQYDTARANLSAAQAALANVELTAPFDGVVAGLNIKAGGSINAGEIAVTVADFSTWLVKTTDLTELDVVTIQQGQAATITLDAIPDITLNGKIRSIGQTYEEKQGDIVYEVTVVLTDQHPNLRWGMTAVVKFEK